MKKRLNVDKHLNGTKQTYFYLTYNLKPHEKDPDFNRYDYCNN
jgi:hypothetical protein